MNSFAKMIFTVAILLAAQYALAGKMNIEQLNQSLSKNHVGWVAKDTWLNNLSPEETKHLFGLQTEGSSDIDFAVPAAMQSQAGALPASMDWRDYQGKNWVSPMLNQANCGSCVAFASIGVLETQANISSLIPNLNLRMSPQYLFNCGGGACDYGWIPEAAARFLMTNGTPDESCLPYTSGATGQDVSCSSACSDSKDRMLKISNYTTPSRGALNINAVKAALLKGPVVTTLTVYQDFLSYSEGVYKHHSGPPMGGHAISIIGYDDALQAWIIRNSWGEDWGEKGFAHVAYSDMSGISNSTWLFQVPTAGGFVSTVSPRDYSYLSGQVAFAGNSSLKKTASLKFNVDGANQQTVTCAGGPCNLNIDTKKMADGRYEMQTEAMDANGTLIGTSTRTFFYVLNSKPQMQLAFTGANGTDLSRPVTGRIEFAINAISSPVPMSGIEIHIKYPTGQEVIRHVSIVLENMTAGWRSNLVPNGRYEIWMVGKIKTNTQEYSVESNHQFVQTAN